MAGAARAAVLVDSCVLLDVITADPQWQAWSAEQLRCCLLAGAVAINPLIFGEEAFAYERIEAVEEVLPRHLYAYWPIPGKQPSWLPGPMPTTAPGAASAR